MLRRNDVTSQRPSFKLLIPIAPTLASKLLIHVMGHDVPVLHCDRQCLLSSWRKDEIHISSLVKTHS